MKTKKTKTPDWRDLMIIRLQLVAGIMKMVGEDMKYHGGIGAMGKRGGELLGYSHKARRWATSIKKTK